MTAKEKAKQLYNVMASNLEEWGWQQTAKEQAIFCVDEILDFMNNLGWKELENGNVDYWIEVKKELNKL